MENEPPITPPQAGPEPPATDPNAPTPSAQPETASTVDPAPAAAAPEAQAEPATPTAATPEAQTETTAPTTAIPGLQTEAISSAAEPSVPTTNVFSPESQPTAPTAPEKKPNNLLKILIPVIALLVVGGIVFLILNSKSSPAEPNNPNNNSNNSDNSGNSDKPDDDSDDNSDDEPDDDSNNSSKEISESWTEEDTTFTVKIDSKTGKFTVAELYGGETYNYNGTLPSDALSKITKAMNSIDFANASADILLKDAWFYTIASFAGSNLNEIIYPCIETDDVEECNVVDTNNDGNLSRRELAYGALNDLMTMVNQ